jgi:hypothetical protein
MCAAIATFRAQKTLSRAFKPSKGRASIWIRPREADGTVLHYPHGLSRDGRRLDSLPRRQVAFIEPMECLAVSKAARWREWVWEIKLDGHWEITVRNGNPSGRAIVVLRKTSALLVLDFIKFTLPRRAAPFGLLSGRQNDARPRIEQEGESHYGAQAPRFRACIQHS